MAEACRAFDTPVVSGNVSFYNETEGRGVLPTPVIGMVGLIEDVKRVIQPGFKHSGDMIAILGWTGKDISPGTTPVLDLALELAVQAACLKAAEAGLLRSAHDCADGGLAVALAECCFSSLNHAAVGAEISLEDSTDPDAQLFGETPSRIIISFESSAREEIEQIAASVNCPIIILGNVGGEVLRVKSGSTLIELAVTEAERAWRSSLQEKLQVEVMAAGAE
jgi:phosphoribosylformylglycinamidine synthase subunit PurL